MRCIALAGALLLATAGSAAGQAADWTVKRDPFDLGVVKRYRAILAKEPWDVRAFNALRTMYRSYRTLDELEDLYKDSTDAPGRIVYARLAPDDADRWQRVLELTEEPRALMALANLDRSNGKEDSALARFRRAVAAATDKATRRAALERLVLLATDLKLAETDALYMQLIDLEPGSAKLWTERGIAMAKLGNNDVAAAAFAKADQLLVHDPAGRLDTIILRARALAASGDANGAREQYERVLATAPRGYYLADEAISGLADLHAGDGTLATFLASLEKRWPPAQRGHFEWTTLATIYERTGDDAAAIAALRKAVAVAPTELNTQRRLIQMLDDAGQIDDAMKQLIVAARAIPGDFDLQVELANRFRTAKNTKAAVETLQRLSRSLRGDARVHEELAELYTKWNRPGLVLHELEELVGIEPGADNIVRLGDAYWASGNEDKASATWKRLGTSVDGLARLAQVYVDHDFWTDAINAYTQAIHKDEKRADLWSARADVFESMGNWQAAANDAQRAVLLAGGATMEAGHKVRYQLIRILSHWSDYEEPEESHLNAELKGWQDAFALDPPDLDAGYLLAEYYGRSPSPEMLPILEKLHMLASQDMGVQLALVRTYKVLHRYDAAVAELRKLLVQDQPHATDYNDQINDLKTRIKLDREDRGLGTETITDPELAMRLQEEHDDPIARVHAGVRMGVGSALRGPLDHSVLAGVYAEVRIAPRLAFVGRLDWTQRGGEMTSMSAVAVSTGVAVPIVNLEQAVITIGAAHRTELRVGEHQGWDTLGLAGDLTLEVMSKKLAGSLGLRFEQGVSDHGQATALLVELGIGN